MKPFARYIFPSLLATSLVGSAAEPTWSNKIIQRQLPDGPDVYLNNIAATGTGVDSPAAIIPDGARFELHTLRSDLASSFMLQSTYVGTYVPLGTVVIDSVDPWGKEPSTDTFTNVSYANPDFAVTKKMPVNTPAKLRRTRADIPFKVYVSVSGLLNGPTDPAASKAVNLYHYTQTYGAGGVGNPIDRSMASKFTLPQITTNSVTVFPTEILTTVTGADRTKIRGEERYTLASLEDNSIPGKTIAANELSTNTIQIWPMSDGSISGLAMDDTVRFAMPKVTFQYNDTYPGSSTFAQVYKGEVRDNADGMIVPGSHKNNTDVIPWNYTESTGGDFDRLFNDDGRWTMEVLTVSPFDTIRLAYVSFTVQRTMQVNGTVTTIE